MTETSTQQTLTDPMPKRADPDRRAAERAHEVHKEFVFQSNAASVENGQSALRTITLINGGAVIALLGFIGVLADKNKLSADNLLAVADSLLWFARGIFCTAVAFGAAFLVNYSTAIGNAAKPLDWVHPYVHECSKSRWCNAFANFGTVVAILSGFVAVLAFGMGAGSIYAAIIKLKL
jgi:hypothetical protein